MPIPIDVCLDRNFVLLPQDLSVPEARRMLEAKTCGVIVGDDGMPLGCVDLRELRWWGDHGGLEDRRRSWPELCVLPEAEARDVVDVASFFRHELREYTSVPGVVLVNELGKPVAVLAWRRMKEALDRAGISFEYTEHHGSYGGLGAMPPETREVLEAPPGLMVTRYGRLRFPARAGLGRSCRLAATINRQPQPGEAGQVELGLTARDWPLGVTASLVGVAPGDFEISGSDTGVIEVPRAADSAPLIFTLIPKSIGQKMVRVRFEQNRAYLGTAFIHTDVVQAFSPSDEAEAQVDYPPVLDARGLPPELTIYIEKLDALTYTVRVRQKYDKAGSPPQEIDRIVFPQPPDRYMQAIFDDLNRSTSAGLGPAEFDAAVAKIGSRLWDELFHETGFKEFYRQHGTYAGTLQIVSDEPYVPWEILRPFRRTYGGGWEAEPFLCQHHAMARWLSGPAPALNLVAHRAALICPPSNLSYVADEVAAVKALPGLEVQVIEAKPALETFLTSGQAEIVHFACHGQFDQAVPVRSALMLGDRYLCPYEVTAEYRNFGCAHPLVFVNACDSGRLGIGLTGIDGWAEAFLKADATAFVGSTWSTADDLACGFATEFYYRLREGYTLGEAMRSAREKIRRPGDATHLSYTLYANPLTRISLPPQEDQGPWSGAAAGENAYNRNLLEGFLANGGIDIRRSPIFDRDPGPQQSPATPDRIAGMLLGLAVGDALGNTSESQAPVARQASHGEIRDYLPNRYAGGRAVGLPSDDTQLAFWTLEQMLEDGGFVPAHVARRFCAGHIFGIGSAVRQFVANLKAGQPWYAAGTRSAGNGALMRIAPILIPHLAAGGRELWVDAALSAMITHNDSASIAACLAFVNVLWQLIGMERAPEPRWWPDTFVAVARDLERGEYRSLTPAYALFQGPLWRFVAEALPPAFDASLSVLDACNGWRSGAYLFETVPSALYILMRHANDPEEAIVRAVNDTWDNDSVAAIVGAAVGALHGRSRLPQRWLDGLSGRTADADDGRVFELVRQATA